MTPSKKDDLKQKWKKTSKKNGRRPQKKMEDDLKHFLNGTQPQKINAR
jgi:hypothetical protein